MHHYVKVDDERVYEKLAELNCATPRPYYIDQTDETDEVNAVNGINDTFPIINMV